MKACLEQKEEEVMQLKHETKRLKTARAYEQKIRRNTELLEEQMREKIGNITRAVSSSFSSGTQFHKSYERKRSLVSKSGGSDSESEAEEKDEIREEDALEIESPEAKAMQPENNSGHLGLSSTMFGTQMSDFNSPEEQKGTVTPIHHQASNSLAE